MLTKEQAENILNKNPHLRKMLEKDIIFGKLVEVVRDLLQLSQDALYELDNNVHYADYPIIQNAENLIAKAKEADK